MSHQWTDTKGNVHSLPKINERIRRRLKRWGVVDLLSVINDPVKWQALFERLASDGEFICNLAYSLEHEYLGTDDEQADFGDLLCGGDSGSGPLLEASEALREAVIDFFPVDRRAAIRQLYQMTVLQTAMEMAQTISQGFHSTESDSATPKSGSNQPSESAELTAAS